MPSPYCWVITKDLQQNKLPGEKSIEGICGPRGCHWKREQIENHANAKRFRMLDDDGEVYCEGYMIDLTGNASGFEPKDDYGEPSLGCTEIQYWESGKGGGWKTL